MIKDDYDVIFTGYGHELKHGLLGPVEEANRFLRTLQVRGLSGQTIRSYAYDLLMLYRWLDANDKDLTELTLSDLLEYVLFQKGIGAHPNSINRRLVVCHLLYRFWTNKEMVPGQGGSLPASYYRGRGRDRALGIHAIAKASKRNLCVKVPRTLIEPLRPKQVTAFFTSLKRYRDMAIVYLMLLCGLRSREVLALKLEDIVFEENRLRVRGKGNVERVMPMPNVLKKNIQEYLWLERPTCCRSPHLFVVLQGKRRGESMTPAGLRSLFRHRRLKPGLASANPHRFRHTFGTDMARSGVRLSVLKEMMGHADHETTLLYINLSMADIADEYKRAVKVIQKRYERK